MSIMHVKWNLKFLKTKYATRTYNATRNSWNTNKCTPNTPSRMFTLLRLTSNWGWRTVCSFNNWVHDDVFTKILFNFTTKTIFIQLIIYIFIIVTKINCFIWGIMIRTSGQHQNIIHNLYNQNRTTICHHI